MLTFKFFESEIMVGKQVSFASVLSQGETLTTAEAFIEDDQIACTIAQNAVTLSAISAGSRALRLGIVRVTTSLNNTRVIPFVVHVVLV
jgi:hypothetical protein